MKRIALALVACAVAGLALVATQVSREPALVVVTAGDTPQDTSWGWGWDPHIIL
ncbi:hypothetical protein BX265_8429 [Streptomyces sp. TLI_235]|nr:hypothetical protein [Streptomyces sp. TLI_235]PBC66214.1 hypothetical protein BX265_8429 [Streptomyces sp. TLI_235]